MDPFSNGTGSEVTVRRKSDYSSIEEMTQVYAGTADIGLDPITKPRAKAPSARPQEETTRAPARRDAIRRTIKHAKRTAERIELARQNDDLIELSNAGFELDRTLQDLWLLRDDRERDWGDVLNILQGVLKKIEFETLSREQCAAVREVVDEHLGVSTVDSTDLEESVILLQSVGLDPWRPISIAED